MSYPYKFYSSKEFNNYGYNRYIVSYNKGFFDDSRNICQMELRYKGRTVIGYEDVWSVFKVTFGGNYKKQIFVYIGEELSRVLHQLDPIKICCKSESIRKVFASSKVLKSYLEDYGYYDDELYIQRFLTHEWLDKTIGFYEVTDEKWLSDTKGEEYMKYLANFTDKLIYDLLHIKKFNLNDLVFKSKEEIEKEVKKVPGWVNDLLKGTLRAGAALLTGGLLANISIPDFGDAIPDLDLNSDFNIDNNSLGGIDLDSNSISNIELDFDYGNSDAVSDYSSISFMGAPNDGTYTDTGQKVSVRSDSGVMYNDIHVFLHHGLRYIDFKNQFIQIPGTRLISLNGNGYKII